MMRLVLACMAATACGHYEFARVGGDGGAGDAVDADDVDDADDAPADSRFAVGPLVWLECELPSAPAAMVIDSSTHGFHGTCAQAQCPMYVAGVRGNTACWFDGVDDGVTIPANFALQLQTFTIAMWIRLDDTPVNGEYAAAFLKATPQGGGETWGVFARDNTGVPQLIAGGDSDGTYHYVDVGRPVIDTWTHVAVTYDGSAYTGYRSGVLISSTPGGLLVDGDAPLWLGFESVAGQRTSFWHGAVDDVRLYGRVLTSSELGAIAGP